MTRTALLFSCSAAALLAACAADTGDSSQDAARGPLGKADIVGSCALTDCDGQSPEGNCWCDDLCVEYGDCCGDRVSVCEAPVAPICGGFAGLSCGDESMYCHYEQEAGCGFADASGTCREVPAACTEQLAPVCGCNGQTYSNSCFAALGGTSVVHDGACDEPAGGDSCGGQVGLACADNQYCEYHAEDLCGAADHLGTCQDIPQACTEEFAPVCGCDGETHSNACFAAMAGTSVVHTGACE
ncbi:MAG TPA: Kazal-type serine protease inhibitor domain-containing protein [Kofleriaceae bacterium]|jgi:hypothetical protein